MEEIASFEQCLVSLKEKGECLVRHCSDQVQAKLNQQIQAHQQGTKDSYSAICSTAQRVSTCVLSRCTYHVYFNFYYICSNCQKLYKLTVQIQIYLNMLKKY